MTTDTWVQRSVLPLPAEKVFDWHLRPGALERLTPPWEAVEVLQKQGTMDSGGRITMRMGRGWLARLWVAEHRDFEPGRWFRDVQLSGPFAAWDHVHRMETLADGSCLLEDRVEYRLPGGWLGRQVAGGWVRRQLARLFHYRHQITRDDLTMTTALPSQPLHVALTGSSGLVGSALVPLLTTQGHRVTRLVRASAAAKTGTSAPAPSGSQALAGQLPWDAATGAIGGATVGTVPWEQTGSGPIDAVVHLAGESVAQGRWTEAKKRRIRQSRVEVTERLCRTLARSNQPPKTLVCASATGLYGDRGDELLTERSPAGAGFLPEVCQAWEAACRPAVEAGIRVVNLRFGVVLSSRGGALAQMLLPFRLGVGGVLGSGRQYFSWLSLDDALGLIAHVLGRAELSGPVNAVSPDPVTNREFTKTLGRVLRRPTILPMPAFAARLAFGQMADDLLLASARVQPEKLVASGYVFRHATLEPALRHLLGKAT